MQTQSPKVPAMTFNPNVIYLYKESIMYKRHTIGDTRIFTFSTFSLSV